MIFLLRLEGLSLGLLALFAFYLIDGSWFLFSILILAPDLSFLGYLKDPKFGAYLYNAMHSWIPALVFILVGYLIQEQTILSIGLIWCAHIGLDRALGYGLKYTSGFKDTHLGKIGNDK